MNLQEYLNTQYRKDCDRQEEILSLMRHVLPLFLDNFDEKKGWPYEYSKEAIKSSSTIAMTADALQYVINADVPKKVFEDCKRKLTIAEGEKEYKGKDAVEAVTKAATKLLVDQTSRIRKNHNFSSNTYGKNSIFVLTWVCELLIQEGGTELPKQFQQLAKSRLNAILPKINAPDTIQFFEKAKGWSSREPNYENSHAFPLLKALRLYELCKPQLGNYGSTWDDNLEEYLLKKLHYCISLASLENSQFDAAELVFSLEGLLIVRTLRLGADENQTEAITPFLCEAELLEKVFSILTEKQRVNRYWRPLRPFITNEQGFALLPISAEIAQSLLRICKRLGKDGKRLFAEHSLIFECYFDWIKSKFTAVNGNYGWCSEHIYDADVIHIWQSSQILLFLTDYYGFLRQKIADDALQAANLSVKQPKANNDSYDFWETKPYGSEKIHVAIKDTVETSKDQSASFLLYGPPGTGKTTFAEKISCLKNWPLLSLSPSDFIADGVDKVEAKAKNLFKVLCAQHNMVIIFDEIDRLMLDRDSADYRAQNDMFQLLVPSLLVKFKELRETPHIIFLVCTNYKCRLDPAVIRPGRIDHHILVLPPDETGRKEFLKDQVQERGIEIRDNSITASEITSIANNTPLYSYGELKRLAKEYCDRRMASKDNDKVEWREIIENHRSTISLNGYLQNIYEEKQKNVPILLLQLEETLHLLHPAKDHPLLRPAEELPLDEIMMLAFALFEAADHVETADERKSKIEELKNNADLKRLLSEYGNQAIIQVGVSMGNEVKAKVEAMIKQICPKEG